MNKSRQWRAGLAAIDLTGRTEPTVGAGQSPASRFRQRASQRNKPSFLTDRPWYHWHQWDWSGRRCGELQLPRERRPWRFH
jgi:hypothetical protein